ncbi:protein FAM237B [Tachyglossus aculeatus]|uniref:protein FAM237B n=1 Tax=Tachyglossus aculeatus TaxID=9261 RepID=UPI0018F4F5E7|nr:protein FAM237B [Tachyglossus aculeatus]
MGSEPRCGRGLGLGHLVPLLLLLLLTSLVTVHPETPEAAVQADLGETDDQCREITSQRLVDKKRLIGINTVPAFWSFMSFLKLSQNPIHFIYYTTIIDIFTDMYFNCFSSNTESRKQNWDEWLYRILGKNGMKIEKPLEKTPSS